MNKLMKIAEIRSIRNAVVEMYPDIADDEQAAFDTLDGETDFVDLVKKALEAEAEAAASAVAVKARITDLLARQSRWELQAKAEREFILRVLEAVDVRKVTLPEATVSLGAKPQSVILTDEEAAIKSEYVRVRTEADKTAIKKALQDGVDLPFAALSNGGVSLTIRRK